MAAARRIGAGAALLIMVAVAIVAIGGALAVGLTLSVGETPARDQARTEAADVTVVDCGQNLDKMTSRLRVTNRSSEPSDYFIDIELVRRWDGEVVEILPAVVEDLDPGASVPVALISTSSAPAHFDCRVGDVDRLST